MIRFLFLSLLITTSTMLDAQKMVNYGPNGDKKKSVTDFFEISLQEKADSGKKASPLLGIAGALGSVLVDFISNKIAARQASYSATYNNSCVLSIATATNYDLLPSKYELVLKRYAIDSANASPDDAPVMCEYRFKFETVTAYSLKLTLSSVKFYYARARVKDGDQLTVGIDLKISTSPNSGAASDTGKNATKPDLGEAMVKIPMIAPSGTAVTKFPLVNSAFFQGFPKPTDGHPAQLTITATVTEANLQHLQPSAIATLFKSNSSDISGILKSIFGGNSGSSSKN